MFSQWAHMVKRKADSFHENLPSRLSTKTKGSSALPLVLDSHHEAVKGRARQV